MNTPNLGELGFIEKKVDTSKVFPLIILIVFATLFVCLLISLDSTFLYQKEMSKVIKQQ